MDILSQAMAQTPTGIAGAASSGPSWTLQIFGGTIVLLSLILIWRNTTVTAGHAILVGIGAAIVSLPWVANFEWTDGGFKFTTKADSLQLAEQVRGLAEANLSLRGELGELGKASKAMAERLSAVEAAAVQSSSTYQPPPADALIYSQPSFLDDFVRKNETAQTLGQQRIQTIEGLQENLQRGVGAGGF